MAAHAYVKLIHKDMFAHIANNSTWFDELSFTYSVRIYVFCSIFSYNLSYFFPLKLKKIFLNFLPPSADYVFNVDRYTFRSASWVCSKTRKNSNNIIFSTIFLTNFFLAWIDRRLFHRILKRNEVCCKVCL